MTLGTATLDAVVDGTNRFVTVTATCTGLTSATFWRRTPEGDVYLRGGINVEDTDEVAIVDYDAPQGTLITYYATVTDGVSTKSAGPDTTVDMVDRGGDCLYDPDAPEDVVLVDVVSFPDLQMGIKQDVVFVIGRPDPVVVSDVRQYPSGTLVVATETAEGRHALNALLASGVVLAFSAARADYGVDDTWFIAVGEATERRGSPLGIVVDRFFDLQVQRVAPPPPLPPDV